MITDSGSSTVNKIITNYKRTKWHKWYKKYTNALKLIVRNIASKSECILFVVDELLSSMLDLESRGATCAFT